MCLQRVPATLDGRPPHPISTSFINRMLNHHAWNALDLDRLGQSLRWYDGLDRPTTDDGYVWFWSLDFRSPAGVIRILIPWDRDRNLDDGSALDRSVTVYADAGVGESQVFQVVFDFSQALATESSRRIRGLATVAP